jgi:hypothetical protein
LWSIDATKSIDSDPGGRVLLHPGGINMREHIFGIVPPTACNVKHCQELQRRAAGVPRAPMPATAPAQASAIRDALHHAGLV